MGTNQANSVSKARGGTITDRILDRIIVAGRQLQQEENVAESDLILIIQNLPQLAEELQQHRRALALICDVGKDPSNVVYLPAS